MPPPLPSVSQSPVQRAPDSPTSVQAASPTLAAAESRPYRSSTRRRRRRLACLAPLKDARAQVRAAGVRAGRARARPRTRSRSSRRCATREAEAAARSRKKKKRKRPAPLRRAAAAGVFLYPEIGAFRRGGMGGGAVRHPDPGPLPSPAFREACSPAARGAAVDKLPGGTDPAPGAPRRPNVPCPEAREARGTAGSARTRRSTATSPRASRPPSLP